MLGRIGQLFTHAPDRAMLADPAEIDRLYRRNRLLVLIAITGGYGLSYTCRLALGVVKKPLIDAGVFSPAELGLIGSAFFYAYAVGKLTNGFIADHVSPRAFLVAGILLSALCNFGMGVSTAVAAAFVLWGVNGWFQSFGAPASVVSMTQWFSNPERGRYFGVWSTAHSIGEGVTFVATGAIVAALGWQAGYFWPAVLCTVVGLVCWKIMQDRPQSVGLPPVAQWQGLTPPPAPSVDAPREPLWRTQLSIFAIRSVWILALASALMYVTRYAINSWGVLYLQEARGYDLTTATSILAINTVTGVAGAVAYGYISDKWFAARRPPANLLFGLMEVIGLLIIFFGPRETWVLCAGMALFGLGLTGLVTAVGLFATDICPRRVAGAALGMVGVFSYLGAAIQENVSGKLIDDGMRLVDGVRTYDFTTPVAFWVGSSVLSLALATLLWRAKLRD